MNVFENIIESQNAVEQTLGNPLNDPLAIERRLTYFNNLRNGNGFRTPKKTPVKNAQGLTRGDRKRLVHDRAFKIGEI